MDDIRGVKIRYRSGVNGRVAIAFAKVPYGGHFDLAEVMSRMLAKRQIRWYRIDAMSPREWDEHRATLTRWQPTLRATSAITHVAWDA